MEAPSSSVNIVELLGSKLGETFNIRKKIKRKESETNAAVRLLNERKKEQGVDEIASKSKKIQQTADKMQIGGRRLNRANKNKSITIELPVLTAAKSHN